jgi:hypothetical protein
MASWVNYMGSDATWNNAALFMGLPAISVDYALGLQFLFNMIGQSWLKTPELMQDYQAILTSPTVDIENIRAITDMITKDALIIPIHEGGGLGRVDAPYFTAGYGERGHVLLWNAEDAWLNK